MLIVLLMNLMVGISSFLLVSKVFKINVLTGFLISFCITYFSQIVFSELALGLFNCLNLNNVLLLNSLILLIVWLITRNINFVFTLASPKEALREILENKTALFLISIILVFSTVKLFINLVNPPFGWDSLNYHFTFAVEWLKNANLNLGMTISDDPSPSYYPINGSLFYLWLMAPLKNVFLADLAQVPFFILAFLAIYGISRNLELSRENSFYGAALFTIIPNFFKQLSIAYVDVMVAGLFLACVYYLFLLSKEFSFRYMLLFALSLGLLLGSKTIALPYSVLLFLPFIFISFKNTKKIYFFVFSIFIIIALGGYSYLRNFFDTGNPLYPLHLELFGRSIFKGVIDNAVYRAHFKIEDYSLAKMLFHEGLGVQTLIFIFIPLFLALPIAIIKKKKPLNFNLLYFLVLPTLIFFVYRYLIPLANTRYLYPLLGTGIILGFYSVENLKLNQRIIRILVVICAIASMSELAKRQELAVSIILTVFLFILVLSFKKINKSGSIFKSSSFVYFFIITAVVLLFVLQPSYIKNEFPRYKKMVKYSGFWVDATDAWLWLNTETNGNNIAYVGRPVPFPLYGENFKNNVYYVSVNKTDPAKLHYFKNSRYSWGYDFLSLHQNLENKDNYRGNADYSVWLKNILHRQTDYLFIYSLHQTKETFFPIEDGWAQVHPEVFVQVFKNKTIHIYKIKK